jgi:hypothetical protein
MMELNTYPEIWREFRASYSQQSSLLRGFDALALFAFLTAVLQAAYAAVTNGYPFHSLISSLCASLGLMVLAIAFRIHLTPAIQSPISGTRAFVEFIVSLGLLFLFVWNIMI